MKFWWRCTLVDTDPPNTRVDLGVVDSETREAAEKKIRLKYKRMFDRMTTNKIRLDVAPGSAPHEAQRAVERKPVDPTGQIFTKEMAP